MEADKAGETSTQVAVRAADEVAKLSAQFSRDVKQSGLTSQAANLTRLYLCKALIELIDDGDAMMEMDFIMGEYRWDDEGNPVDENGKRFPEWYGGRVHPDNPCQKGAFL